MVVIACIGSTSLEMESPLINGLIISMNNFSLVKLNGDQHHFLAKQIVIISVPHRVPHGVLCTLEYSIEYPMEYSIEYSMEYRRRNGLY